MGGGRGFEMVEVKRSGREVLGLQTELVSVEDGKRGQGRRT